MVTAYPRRARFAYLRYDAQLQPQTRLTQILLSLKPTHCLSHTAASVTVEGVKCAKRQPVGTKQKARAVACEIRLDERVVEVTSPLEPLHESHKEHTYTSGAAGVKNTSCFLPTSLRTFSTIGNMIVTSSPSGLSSDTMWSAQSSRAAGSSALREYVFSTSDRG